MAHLEKHAVTEVHWPQLQPTVAAVTKKTEKQYAWAGEKSAGRPS